VGLGFAFRYLNKSNYQTKRYLILRDVLFPLTCLVL
jgi:hypothetical protein